MYKSIYFFLWEVIKPYKIYYLIMLLGPIGSALYLFANNYSLKLVIDVFSQNDHLSFEDLSFPIIFFISSQFIPDICWRISNVAEWKSEPYVRRSIINLSYDRLQNYSYKFFQENFVGSIVSKVKSVLDGYDNFWGQMHHEFTRGVFEVAVLSASLLLVSKNVCIFIIIWGISFMIIMYHMAKKLSLLSYEYTNCKHNIFGTIADNISNIFSVFAFATRKKELEIIDNNLSDEFIPRQITLYKYNFKIQIIAGLLYFFMLFSIFIYIVFLRNEAKISTGDVIFVLSTTLVLSDRLWNMINNMQEFIKQMGDFKSSFEILQHPLDNIDKENAVSLNINKASIKFENVNFGYDENRPIFENLNLDIKCGEKVGIVGISGAGKSTLVGILLKHFAINGGKVSISGQDIDEVTSDSIRENISLIPQDIMLFHRSILENIRYGNLAANDKEVKKTAKMANLENFINNLPDKYDTQVGERGVKLSGGQRQRIAIARAILKNAPILILDEASSALDTETERLIQESINLMLENKKFTIIAIAHRLSTLKHMDRIIVIDGGKIIEEGTHEHLIRNKNSLYKKLWEMQQL